MRFWHKVSVTALVLGAAGAGTWSVAEAHVAHGRPSDATAARPGWFDSIEGWQVGVWGAPGAHRWQLGRDGRGVLTMATEPRPNVVSQHRYGFTLTLDEHRRFAGLIERFTDGPQDAGLCATDQAQDIIRWRGGTRGEGLFNFDHGCRDAANMQRLALLTEAIGILRTAAERHSAS